MWSSVVVCSLWNSVDLWFSKFSHSSAATTTVCSVGPKSREDETPLHSLESKCFYPAHKMSERISHEPDGNAFKKSAVCDVNMRLWSTRKWCRVQCPYPYTLHLQHTASIDVSIALDRYESTHWLGSSISLNCWCHLQISFLFRSWVGSIARVGSVDWMSCVEESEAITVFQNVIDLIVTRMNSPLYTFIDWNKWGFSSIFGPSMTFCTLTPSSECQKHISVLSYVLVV